MPSLRDIAKQQVGRYYVGVGPAFGGSTPSEGSTSTISASGGFTTLFDADAVNSKNYGAVTFTTSGALPSGFTFNATTGVLSGSYTLQAININGNFAFQIIATESNPTLPVATAASRNLNIFLSVPFKVRQVVTTGYMLGGYQNGQLWSNVNRFTHSNDSTTNLGDGRIQNYHYKSGATDLTRTYMWNGGFVTAFNMRTEVRNDTGSINFNGGNTSFVWDPDRTYGWVNGEGCNQVRRWDFSTLTITSNRGSGWSDHSASISGEDRGIYWGNSGQTQRIIYSTESIAGVGTSAGAHGQQKGLSSKDGKGYGGEQGGYNGGYQFRVTSTVNEGRITNVGKPFGNMGEENYGHGQDKGYCIGTYDGSQNNRSFVLTYSTNSGFETGGTTQPKGHGGCSSGHCGFRD